MKKILCLTRQEAFSLILKYKKEDQKEMLRVNTVKLYCKNVLNGMYKFDYITTNFELMGILDNLRDSIYHIIICPTCSIFRCTYRQIQESSSFRDIITEEYFITMDNLFTMTSKYMYYAHVSSVGITNVNSLIAKRTSIQSFKKCLEVDCWRCEYCCFSTIHNDSIITTCILNYFIHIDPYHQDYIEYFCEGHLNQDFYIFTRTCPFFKESAEYLDYLKSEDSHKKIYNLIL